MKFISPRPVAVLMILLDLAFWAPQAAPVARACTAPPEGPPNHSVAARAQAAPIVIEGIVKSIDEPHEWYSYGATVEVFVYLKGQGESTLHIDGYGTAGLCLVDVWPGERHVFYVWRDQQGHYRAHYLGEAAAVSPDTPEVVNQVRAALLPHSFGLPSLLRFDTPPPDGIAMATPDTPARRRAR